MKKQIAMILILFFLLSFAAGCGSDDPTVSPPDGDLTPVKTIQRDVSEISLEGLDVPWCMTVDAAGNIYVDGASGNGDGRAVYKVGEDNRPAIFIEGLTRCRGLSAVGGILYVFDLRDDLFLLSYDLQGNPQNEWEILLSEDISKFNRGFVFQDIPIAYLDFGSHSYMPSRIPPYLYNLETKKAAPVPGADTYYYIDPVADGQLVCNVDNAFSATVVLTIGADGGITETSVDRQKTGRHVGDIVTGEQYSVEQSDVKRIIGDDWAFAVNLPEGITLILNTACVNRQLYLHSKDIQTEEQKILIIDIPEQGDRRILRVSERMYSGFDEISTFIEDFAVRHPEIEIRRVPLNISINDNGDLLRLLAGEMNVDLIITYDKYGFHTAGIARDLSQYPGIVKALDNPNLLEGVKEGCLATDGSLFGVPLNIAYNGYFVNEALFQRYGLEIPSADWTVYDYYALAKEVAALRGRGEDVYLEAKVPSLRRTQTGLRAGRVETALPIFIDSSGFNSSNGFGLRINTPEMIDIIEKAGEIYGLFPFLDLEPYYETGWREAIYAQFSENLFLYSVFANDVIDAGRSEKYQDPKYPYISPFTDEFLANRILPPPRDMYGNRRIMAQDYLTVYARAGNPDDAAVFITEFLDEDWHYQNAQTLQLFRDSSAYDFEFAKEMKAVEPLIVERTKDAVYAYTELYTIWPYVDFLGELEEKFFQREITAGQFAETFHKEMERRLLG